jgi:hypothetical protein
MPSDPLNDFDASRRAIMAPRPKVDRETQSRQNTIRGLRYPERRLVQSTFIRFALFTYSPLRYSLNAAAEDFVPRAAAGG